MLRETPLFGALAPSLVLYFLAAVSLFALIDQLANIVGIYRLFWHPPLARLGVFLLLFSGLVLLTRP
jgi:hypothetical protein